MKCLFTCIILMLTDIICFSQKTDEIIVLQDLVLDKISPAAQKELTISSNGSLLQGFMYKANGGHKHPTLLLLHGYPGNERNLDLAQAMRSQGWNVIYFNYRGAWGSQGVFSLKNCVQDVVNVVSFCKKYHDSLQIDTANIALFGHSMGAWVCLKALQQLPSVKKGFAVSTWDIGGFFKNIPSEQALIKRAKEAGDYFVLNTPLKNIFGPVLKNPAYYNIANDALALSEKQIIMLDEHGFNQPIANAIKNQNKAHFEYLVWQTDHPFTNKRASLINKVLGFLNKQ
jgi:uncharacterized protein